MGVSSTMGTFGPEGLKQWEHK